MTIIQSTRIQGCGFACSGLSYHWEQFFHLALRYPTMDDRSHVEDGEAMRTVAVSFGQFRLLYSRSYFQYFRSTSHSSMCIYIGKQYGCAYTFFLLYFCVRISEVVKEGMNV
uniref:Uncharacterized protein n=1 Tax=Trypanosoma vivax (strain Y486) TaxID=1055687 RepID=G0U6Y4_TRYVY|nr:hypothetical protein TVY486_1006880 [Trypanosoma vivax Y486]